MRSKLTGAIAASAMALALVGFEGAFRPAQATDAACGGGVDVQCRVVKTYVCIAWKLQPSIQMEGFGITYVCATYEEHTDYYYYPRVKPAAQ